MPAGTVEVFLIGAVGIKDTELFGKADPYAVLSCGGQKLRSNTASNQGSKPVWNQKFSFYVDDNTSDLQIRVYNHNILTEDDELGSTIIPLAKVFTDGKLPTTSYNCTRPSGRVQGEVKLSITFIPKIKTSGHQTAATMAGPYNGSVHGSPYSAPEPTVKHDPLTGPYGYFKNNSGSATSSSHGGRLSAILSDVGLGGSKPPPKVDAYPPSLYPPVPSGNKPQAPYPGNKPQVPYPRTESSMPYDRTDSFTSTSSDDSSHGGSYRAPSSADYGGSVYHQSPYGRGQPSAPPGAVRPGNVPMPPPSPGYPPPAGQYPGYPSGPSTKPSLGGGNQYGRFDELAGNFGALNVSGGDSEASSHGSFPAYHSMQTSNDRPPSGYPPMESCSHPHHSSSSRPPSGYPPPPPGYPTSGYPSQYDTSGHGNLSHPGSYSMYGHEAPPSSYYPPQLGVSNQPYSGPDAGNPPSSNAYPPSPYYNAPSAHYVPAGYPK